MTTTTEAPVTAPPPVAARPAKARHRWLIRVGSLVTALVVWQVLTSLDIQFWLNFDRLPTPVEVADDLSYQLGTSVYYQDLVDSLVRILAGFVLAAVFGVAIGTAIARSRTTADVVQPLLEVVRPIPAMRWCPSRSCCSPATSRASSSSPSWPRSSRSW
jgi:NitT/TauT family transport system permease protein